MKRNAKPIRVFKRVTPEQEQECADALVPALCLASLQYNLISANWPLFDEVLAESDLKDALRRMAGLSKSFTSIFEERINHELMEGLLDDSGNVYDKYVVPMVNDSKAAQVRHKAQKG